MTTKPARALAALLVVAAAALSGCGPQEDIDARLQRVTLDVPFGTVTDQGEAQ